MLCLLVDVTSRRFLQICFVEEHHGQWMTPILIITARTAFISSVVTGLHFTYLDFGVNFPALSKCIVGAERVKFVK